MLINKSKIANPETPYSVLISRPEYTKTKHGYYSKTLRSVLSSGIEKLYCRQHLYFKRSGIARWAQPHASIHKIFVLSDRRALALQKQYHFINLNRSTASCAMLKIGLESQFQLLFRFFASVRAARPGKVGTYFLQEKLARKSYTKPGFKNISIVKVRCPLLSPQSKPQSTKTTPFI